MAEMTIDENEYERQQQTPSVASGSDTLHKIRYEEITDEDKALLIDTMRNYQIIWDTSYEEDGKRGKQKEAFEMMVDEMNEKVANEERIYTIDVIRRVWKTLRENFTYYTKKRTTTKKGKDLSNIKFKFFDRMSFLLKPEQSAFSSYEECISMLASNVNGESLNGNEVSNQPLNIDNLIQQQEQPLIERKRRSSPVFQPAGINGIKRFKHEFGHTNNETTTINNYNKTQMAACTLAVNATNNDLIAANLTHIARQFRNEINAVVMKYEQILIDHEKQELQH